MFQSRQRNVLGSLFAALLLGLGGCSSSRHSTKVDESWLARVPPDQMNDVRQAQATLNQAEDQVTRAKVSEEDGKRELKVARKEEKAAKASRDAAQSAVKAARESGQGEDPNAQQRLEQADAQLAAAKAQVAWRERVAATRKSLRTMRERERDVAKAELEQTRYQTLQQSGDVRAEKLNGQEFARKVDEAKQKAQQTQQVVENDLKQQREARAEWQKLDSQVQATGGSGR